MTIQLAITVLSLALLSSAQAKEKGIEEYFLELPESAEFLEGKPAQLLNYIHNNHQGEVDRENGYLTFNGDGAQVSLQVALFRYQDRRPLLAVSYGLLEQPDYTHLAFFEEREGKMRPASIAFPVKPAGNKYVFELPHRGRVITVKDQRGKIVGKARFDGSGFVDELSASKSRETH